MRILLGCLICLAICSGSHLSGKEKYEMENNPPGTVWLKDSLYIDKTEIANVHWREFLFFQQRNFGDSSVEFTKILLDTLVWSALDYASGLPDIYFRHPSFNNSPAVGMSYVQVLAFCKWRTDMVNQLLAKHPNRKFKKVLYRLPTIDEWRLAAANGISTDTSPYGMKSPYDKKGRLLIFCKDNLFITPTLDYGIKVYTVSVNSFYPNNIGLYHLAGNVSEMISEEGKAMGGNFMLPLDSCRVNLIHTYKKPEAWLGFRCVCEIIE